MSFLFCRLFKRPKPHSTSDLLASNKQQAANKLHRSATAHAEVHPSSSSTDSDDEADDVIIAGPSSAPESFAYRRTVFGDSFVDNPMVNRRAGGELQRARIAATPGESSTRVSISSSADGTSFDDRLRQQYSRLKRIHTGRMALIFQGTDRQTKRPVVIKSFNKVGMPASKQAKIQQEQNVLRTVSGQPGIVKLLNVVEDMLHTHTVLENVPGFTLIELMANNGGRLPEARCVVEVAYPLLRALAGLHAHGIVHRDVRPEHVMCSYGTIKLVDFTESASKHQQCLNDRVGQLPYMAPEMLCKPSAEEIFHQVLYEGMSETDLPQYNEKADIWSAGVVIYEALTGMQPFLGETAAEMMELHEDASQHLEADGFPSRLVHPNLSPLARQFLATVLQVDPAERPAADELLTHPFVVKHMSSQTGQWLLPQQGTTGTGRCSSQNGHVGPAGGGTSLIDSHLIENGNAPLVDCLLSHKTVDVSVR